MNFNSHAHVERDSMTAVTQPLPLNFNSHAHVERDGTLNAYHCRTTISTHTLTWSVTGKTYSVCKQEIISTHTLTWSVTF